MHKAHIRKTTIKSSNFSFSLTFFSLVIWFAWFSSLCSSGVLPGSTERMACWLHRDSFLGASGLTIIPALLTSLFPPTPTLQNTNSSQLNCSQYSSFFPDNSVSWEWWQFRDQRITEAGRNLRKSLVWLIPLFGCSQGEKASPYIPSKSLLFQFMPIVCDPSIMITQKSLAVFLVKNLPSSMRRLLLHSAEDVSSPGWSSSSSSLFSQAKYYHLEQSWGTPLNLYQFTDVFLVLGYQNSMLYLDAVWWGRSRGHNHFRILAPIPSVQPGMLVPFLAARAHGRLMPCTSSNRTPHLFPQSCIPPRQGAACCAAALFFLPKHRSLHLPLMNFVTFLSAHSSSLMKFSRMEVLQYALRKFRVKTSISNFGTEAEISVQWPKLNCLQSFQMHNPFSIPQLKNVVSFDSPKTLSLKPVSSLNSLLVAAAEVHLILMSL